MRIRTIKPELWTDLDMAGISESALLLAIGLLNLSDDEGFFAAHPGLIKGSLFPVRELTRPVIDCLDELVSVGFIEIHSGHDGHNYGEVVNFKKHQVISKPRKSSIRSKIQAFREDSRRIPGGVMEDSGTLPSGSGMEIEREIEWEASNPAKPVDNDLSDSNLDPLEALPELSDFYNTLCDMILQEHPRASIPTMLTRRWFDWRDTLAKLHTRDGFEVPEIIAALIWCFEGEEATERWPGWRAQVQAIPALRKRKSADDLTKFAKIHAAWRQADGAGASRPYRNADHVMTPEEVAAWDRI